MQMTRTLLGDEVLAENRKASSSTASLSGYMPSGGAERAQGKSAGFPVSAFSTRALGTAPHREAPAEGRRRPSSHLGVAGGVAPGGCLGCQRPKQQPADGSSRRADGALPSIPLSPPRLQKNPGWEGRLDAFAAPAFY